MKLAEIRKNCARTLTIEEARTIVGNQATIFVRNMDRALQLMTWQNTPDDWMRLQAARMVLRHGRK